MSNQSGLLLALLAFLLSIPTTVGAQHYEARVPAAFAREHEFKDEDVRLTYNLFVPTESAEFDNAKPLILTLHGIGERRIGECDRARCVAPNWDFGRA